MPSILRYNLKPSKAPINFPKEVSVALMEVILTVRHCEQKCMSILLVILMHGGFDPKCNVDPFDGDPANSLEPWATVLNGYFLYSTQMIISMRRCHADSCIMTSNNG